MRWSGVNRGISVWVGGATGLAYLMLIEIMDGFSAQWGFSKGDMAADIFGSAFFRHNRLCGMSKGFKCGFHFTKVFLLNIILTNWEQTFLKD